LLVFQFMESLGAVLLRFLAMDLVPSMFLLQKNLAHLCDNPTRDNSVLSPKPLHLVIKR
jgi:hypothetical protein